jgi:ribosomal-protein-alanine N-acetyltransferase
MVENMPDIFSIATPRLNIRETRMSDDALMLTAMACPVIHAMHSNGFNTIDDVRRYLALLTREYLDKKYRTLAIAEKQSDALCGAVTIDIHTPFARAELSYWISIPHRNKGYATEAVEAMIGYGFSDLGLNRVQAAHNVDNPASGRVLEKAGMAYEGTLRKYYSINGSAWDVKMYAAVN